jgi:hypothetical protein
MVTSLKALLDNKMTLIIAVELKEKSTSPNDVLSKVRTILQAYFLQDQVKRLQLRGVVISCIYHTPFALTKLCNSTYHLRRGHGHETLPKQSMVNGECIQRVSFGSKEVAIKSRFVERKEHESSFYENTCDLVSFDVD